MTEENKTQYFCNTLVSKRSDAIKDNPSECSEGNYDNGLYAFIYIEGEGFVGNNKGNEIENNIIEDEEVKSNQDEEIINPKTVFANYIYLSATAIVIFFISERYVKLIKQK